MNAKRSKFRNILFGITLLTALFLSACGLGQPTPTGEAVEVTRIVNQVVTATPKPVDARATAAYEATQMTASAETQAAKPAGTELPVATEAPIIDQTVMPTEVISGDDSTSAYNIVVELCQAGMSYAQIGAVSVPCDQGPILAAPSGNDQILSVTYDSHAITTELTGMDTNCPTNAAMFAAHGWAEGQIQAVKTGINVPWEGCAKWQVQANGIGTYQQPLEKTYEYTVTMADGRVLVFYGDGVSTIEVWGATIRYLPNYTLTEDQAWVLDPLRLLLREFNYGFSMTPRYGTYAGNIDTDGWTPPDLDTTCPTSTLDAAAILGGDDPKYWTEPDWSGGAWVFQSKGDGFHHLTHPGAGYFDVWVDGPGAVSVYAEDPQGYLQRLNFEEASFHCTP